MDQGSSVKRIVFFTHQNPQGYRVQQYFPFIEDGGFNVELLTSRMNFLKVIDRIRGADVLYIQRLLLNYALSRQRQRGLYTILMMR
jgi:hypothetical protein